MSQFIETIRIENNSIFNLEFHNQRMNQTRKELFGCNTKIDLAEQIQNTSFAERTKCRIVYSEAIESIEYTPYHIRPVHTLKIVQGLFTYPHKSIDRNNLNKLFAQRTEADDILIEHNGFLTDTSICNIALWNGTEWHTPKHPLLKGTHRARLLKEEKIVEKEIRTETLYQYQQITLFNALIDFKEICFEINRKSIW